MPPITEVDQYADLDTKAVAAEIGESLFGATEAAPEKPIAETVDTPAEASAPAADKPPASPAAAPVVDPNAPAVVLGENAVAKPLPKSWKKELGPEWEKMSPAVREYVHEREAQVMRGINQYQQGYQAWDNLIKPFAPVLEANPDVNPIILMQGLMATHLQLLSPTLPAAEKTSLVKKLLTEYGINLEPGTAPQVDAALIARLNAAEAKITSWERSQRQTGIDTFKREVDAFSANPENEHFNEVANDILRFIQNGTASGLKDAYELACWANPAVRAKLIAKQQKPTPGAAPRGKNGQFLNIEADSDVKPVPAKVGTIDQTIDAVIAKAYTKH